MADSPAHNDDKSDDVDWGLMVNGGKLSFDKVGSDSVKQALDLLEERNRLEFNRFQNLEVKGAALFSGILVLLAVSPRSGLEQWLALLLFIPLFILGKMFIARRFAFAPKPSKILEGMLTAQNVEPSKQFSCSFSSTIRGLKTAIEANFEINNIKAGRINQALIAMAVWAVIWIIAHLVQLSYQPEPQRLLRASTTQRITTALPTRQAILPSMDHRSNDHSKLPRITVSPKPLPK